MIFIICATILICSISYVHIFTPINIVSYDRDIWHHMASLNALMDSPFHAVNPHIVSDEASRTFMPWYVLLAIIGNIFGLTSTKILGVSAVLSLTFFMVGIFLFSQEYYENKWSPIILMMCLFGTWGLSASYTGYYNLETLIYSISYPYGINLALGFIGWWLTLRQLDNDKINFGLLGFIIFLCAFMFATHQLQGAFAIGGMALFSLFSRQNNISIRIALLGSILIGILLSGLWPYYNPLKMVVATGHANWNGNFILFKPANIAQFTGLAMLGILGVYNFEQKKIRYDLLLAIVVITAGYLIGESMSNPISHRFHAFITVFLQISLVAFLLSRFAIDQPFGKLLALTQKISGGLIVILLAVNLYTTVQVYKNTRNYLSHHNTSGPKTWHPDIVNSMSQLKRKVSPDNVMIAHKITAYPVQAYRMKVVSIPRPFPLVKDMAERQQASIDFFSTGVSEAQRWDIIQTYNVSHIIYRLSWLNKSIADDLDKFGTKTIINDDLALIETDFNIHPIDQPRTKKGAL